MMICNRLEGEVQYNDGQFADVRTVGTEGSDKGVLLGAIQLHRENTNDTPEEFKRRLPVGTWLDIGTTMEVTSRTSSDCR